MSDSGADGITSDQGEPLGEKEAGMAREGSFLPM